MKCKVCGCDLPEGSVTCRICGTPIEESQLGVSEVQEPVRPVDDADFNWNTFDFPKPKQPQDIEMVWPQFNVHHSIDADEADEQISAAMASRRPVSIMKDDASEGYVSTPGRARVIKDVIPARWEYNVSTPILKARESLEARPEPEKEAEALSVDFMPPTRDAEPAESLDEEKAIEAEDKKDEEKAVSSERFSIRSPWRFFAPKEEPDVKLDAEPKASDEAGLAAIAGIFETGPAEGLSEASIEAPAEGLSEASIEAPTEELSEELTETAAEGLSEASIEAPAEELSEELTEAPAEDLPEESAEAPIEQTEELEETPAEEPLVERSDAPTEETVLEFPEEQAEAVSPESPEDALAEISEDGSEASPEETFEEISKEESAVEEASAEPLEDFSGILSQESPAEENETPEDVSEQEPMDFVSLANARRAAEAEEAARKEAELIEAERRARERFYTFNKKNEEFQALLDAEYARVKALNLLDDTETRLLRESPSVSEEDEEVLRVEDIISGDAPEKSTKIWDGSEDMAPVYHVPHSIINQPAELPAEELSAFESMLLSGTRNRAELRDETIQITLPKLRTQSGNIRPLAEDIEIPDFVDQPDAEKESASEFVEVSEAMGEKAFSDDTCSLNVEEMRRQEEIDREQRSLRKRRLEEMARAREEFFGPSLKPVEKISTEVGLIASRKEKPMPDTKDLSAPEPSGGPSEGESEVETAEKEAPAAAKPAAEEGAKVESKPEKKVEQKTEKKETGNVYEGYSEKDYRRKSSWLLKLLIMLLLLVLLFEGAKHMAIRFMPQSTFTTFMIDFERDVITTAIDIWARIREGFDLLFKR